MLTIRLANNASNMISEKLTFTLKFGQVSGLAADFSEDKRLNLKPN